MALFPNVKSFFKNTLSKCVRLLGIGEKSEQLSPSLTEEPKELAVSSEQVFIDSEHNEWIVLGTEKDAPDTLVIKQQPAATEDFEDEFVKIPISTEPYATDIGHDCELLAKYEAYNLAVPTTISRDKAAAARQRLAEQGYKLYQLGTAESRTKGLFLNALVKEEDPTTPITITCRGTQGDASIIADLDPNGPGYALVNENRATILAQLNELCHKYPGRKIRITGHSLGGALSQLLAHLILEVKANPVAYVQQYEFLSAITGIDTVVFQSAGVSEDIARQIKENAIRIKNSNPAFINNFIAHIKEGDFVSRTGAYIFSDVLPETANVSLIKLPLGKPCITLSDAVDIGVTAATSLNPVWIAVKTTKTLAERYVSNRLEAHGDFFFHEKEDKTDKYFGYGVLSNQIPEDREVIQKTLTRNLIACVPFSASLQQAAYAMTEGLTNDEVHGTLECLGSIPRCVSIAGDCLAAASPGKLLAVGVRHIGKVTEIGTTLSEHHAHFGHAILKMFNRVTGRRQSTPVQQDEHHLAEVPVHVERSKCLP
jgi:hypothetical protein